MKLISIISFIAVLSTVYIASINPSSQFNISEETHLFNKFVQWKIQFSKNYQNINQEIYRFNLFKINLIRIQSHNTQTSKTYQMGLNQFSDLTQQQFKSKHLTFINQNTQAEIQIQKPLKNHKQIFIDNADGQINWVQLGYVTSVKDQGQCGACWAFAALGPLQAMVKQQGGTLNSLSAQQIMDCSKSYGNYGCNGGFMDSAYQYIRDKGVTTDQKYPYKGINQPCLTDGGQYKVKGFVDIKDCKTLASSLMKIPIAVAVDATKWYNYKSGVFSDCNDKVMLNHAVALVGMTNDYWLGKQQWGVKWGQNGYIKISKTGLACGICQMASYPV